MPTARPRFAVYLRISRDPDGTSTAPERQLKDCRAFAELRGWDITTVHRDADVSAYRTGVKRPAYGELLAGIRAGAYDGVLVWRLDRLVRRTVEFADFWRLADARGVRLASATQPVDTGDPVGMLIVHILVAFAEMESATMSARIRAKERELADNGHNKTAGWRKKRSYGHEAGWEAVHEPEAAVIREIARRVLDGESIRSVYVDLNGRGVPAPGGGRWSRQGVVALVRSARLFGWRDYEGELTARGDWPAIISEADGRALRALLDRPANTGNRRRHLLSSLLRCGRCAGPMRAGRTTTGVGRYVCLPKAEGGCGAVSILMDPTDEAVDQMVIDQLETPAMAATLAARRRDHDASDEAAMLAELHQLKQRTDENAADRASGAISRAAYLATQQAIDRQTEILSKRLADQRQVEPLDALAAGNGQLSALADRYQALPVDRRRGVIETLTERITVRPVDDPTYLERLRVTLAEEADACRAEAAELRTRAKQATPDDAAELRRQAMKRDADARRRGRQIARGGNSASVFRVERLDPVWRV
jgi:DNA invertase Pin-like site-specific DNA recombinase